MVDCKRCVYYGRCDIARNYPGRVKKCRDFKIMTNNDKLNAMSPEEKAAFFGDNPADKMAREWCEKLCPNRIAGVEECDCPYSEQDAILQYLKSEVKE